MSELLELNGVSVEFVDTTVNKLLGQYPNLDSDRVMRVAGLVARIGASVIELGDPNNELQTGLVSTVSSAFETLTQIDCSQKDPDSLSALEVPRLSIVSNLSQESIEIAFEAIERFRASELEFVIPTKESEYSRVSIFGDEINFDRILEGPLEFAMSLLLDNEDIVFGTSFEDPMRPEVNSNFLRQMIRNLLERLGTNLINFKDTSNQADPFLTYEFFMEVFNILHESSSSSTIVSVEFGNDYGLALANSLYFIKAAIDFARYNNTSLNTRVKTNVANLGNALSGCDIISLSAAIDKYLLNQISAELVVIKPELIKEQIDRAVEVFRILELDIPLRAPVIGYETRNNLRRS